MDKCVMEDKDITTCNLTGQFVPVCLLGDARCCKDESADSWNATCEIELAKRLGGWQIRFTHFVQLGLEPNESPLWYLLGRRAAGSFACSHRCGADLLIPSFVGNQTAE
ncbi:hypothetical protein GQ600_7162 [Phytophthora cactorum]|nr:hypothetical protein GQ600_7162 [Phytophthora cactorum]